MVLTTSSKRRRNTEASARFRAKKKEREQAVEKRASESCFLLDSNHLLCSTILSFHNHIPSTDEKDVNQS